MKMKALNEFTKAAKTRTGRSETSSNPATRLMIGHGLCPRNCWKRRKFDRRTASAAKVFQADGAAGGDRTHDFCLLLRPIKLPFCSRIS